MQEGGTAAAGCRRRVCACSGIAKALAGRLNDGRGVGGDAVARHGLVRGADGAWACCAADVDATPRAVAARWRPGRNADVDLEGAGLRVGRPRAVAVRVASEGGAGRGTAWHVWDGAVVLARHLHHRGAEIERSELGADVAGVLELGSGTGLVGLSAAACFPACRCVALTDLPEALPALRRNAALNAAWIGGGVRVEVLRLDWREAAGRGGCLEAGCVGGGLEWDLVVASDCVWLPELVEPFADALAAALRSRRAVAVLATQERSARVDAALWAGLRTRGLRVRDAPMGSGEPPRGAIRVTYVDGGARAADDVGLQRG
ncbi:unnamed protein product [Pedinophyceae sp. YPF-701]|nr:unnamed protein product [Pedinophyceae sp. YPF-701]